MGGETVKHVIRGDFCSGKIKKKYVFLIATVVILLLIASISIILLLITLYGGSKHCEATEFEKQESTDQIINITSDVTSNHHFKVVPRRTWLAQPAIKELQKLQHPLPDVIITHTASEDPNVNVTLSGKLKIIPRRMWLAQPPTEEPNKLRLPVPYVIIMHTASEQCKNQADCIFAIRHIQAFHTDSIGWRDIGYNFLIGGDGFAYEGQGWTFEGAQTYGYNSKSIGIAFVGTYNTVLPTEAQMTTAKQLIEEGVTNGYLAEDYKVLGSRQVSTTKSPGLMLYEEIKKWPHWSSSP